MVKDKSPVVPFYGITLPYSYFEEILIFAPIQQEAKHNQQNGTKKFVDKAFLPIKPKFKFAVE